MLKAPLVSASHLLAKARAIELTRILTEAMLRNQLTAEQREIRLASLPHQRVHGAPKMQRG